MISVLKKKLDSKKGFTLTELLIVVGIIAILVAVAVPVFSGQLKNAEEAVKSANIRAARVEASTHYLMNKQSGTWEYKFTVTKDGKITLDPPGSGTNPTSITENADSKEDSCTPDADKGGYNVTVYITGTEYDSTTGD